MQVQEVGSHEKVILYASCMRGALQVWDLVLPEIIMLRDVSMEKAFYPGYAMLLGSQYFRFFSYFLCNEFLSFSWVISWVVRMKIGVLHFPQAFLPTFLLQRVKLIYTPAQCLHSSIFEFWFQLVVSVPGNGVHKPLLFCFCGKNNTRKRVPLPYLFNCLQHAGNANTHYTSVSGLVNHQGWLQLCGTDYKIVDSEVTTSLMWTRTVNGSCSMKKFHQ